MTHAKQIALQFNEDGMCWQKDGINICDACAECAESTDQNWERECTRYTFADGSVITVQDGVWDYGYTDCFCWRECGHDESRCEARNHE